MTDFPDLKIKALVNFPASAFGGTGTNVRKQNGQYFIDLAYGDFAPPITGLPSADIPNLNVLAWNVVTNRYLLTPMPLITNGIFEAPNDGVLYGRKSLAWSVVTPGIADAPNDGTLYGRKSLGWVSVPAGGGTPSTTNPLMDGIATPGVAVTYARGDHVHPTDTSTVRTLANGNIVGGASSGAALTTSINNVFVGNNAGKSVAGGSGENILVGINAGMNMTTGTQNTVVGSEAGSAITGDTGHTFVGFQAGLSSNSNASTWNTFVGHSAGRFMTTGGSCVAVGRAAIANDTDGTYITAIGHASYYWAAHGSGVIALGDGAAGAPVDGTGTNWQGTGLTYYGSFQDTSCSYIGRFSGKATVAARANSHAIGLLARLPARDNVMVLGHGLAAVTTAGRMYDGWNRTDISANAGMTLTAAVMLTGLVVRSGTLAGPVNDTSDTAANLVLAGPGPNAEVPCSLEFSFGNLTGQTITLVGGTGVAFSSLGLGGAVAPGVLARFRILYNLTTPGSESCTLYRVG